MKSLTDIQLNVLIASIIGDGEITKIYPGSRRINNSYREHYGVNQKDYRIWKQQFLKEILYITPKSSSLRSKSSSLFTNWYPHFYKKDGDKQIPTQLLLHCQLPHFLAVLYMDDGSLCISRRINDRKKKIYLTPHIYLYLQNYPKEQLKLLQKHIYNVFKVQLHLAKRNDGHGFILRTTTVKETYKLLEIIKPVSIHCPSMYYKTNWLYRYEKETKRYNSKYPTYKVLYTDSNRSRPYSDDEISLLTSLKEQGYTDQKIADTINRSYWSVVYKLSELRKLNKIPSDIST